MTELELRAALDATAFKLDLTKVPQPRILADGTPIKSAPLYEGSLHIIRTDGVVMKLNQNETFSVVGVDDSFVTAHSANTPQAFTDLARKFEIPSIMIVWSGPGGNVKWYFSELRAFLTLPTTKWSDRPLLIKQPTTGSPALYHVRRDMNLMSCPLNGQHESDLGRCALAKVIGSILLLCGPSRIKLSQIASIMPIMISAQDAQAFELDEKTLKTSKPLVFANAARQKTLQKVKIQWHKRQANLISQNGMRIVRNDATRQEIRFLPIEDSSLKPDFEIWLGTDRVPDKDFKQARAMLRQLAPSIFIDGVSAELAQIISQ